MRFSVIFGAVVASATLAVSALPARAEPALGADNICPAVGGSTGCNLLITFNQDGSITTSPGSSPGTYDGSDDTLIGVINFTSSTIFGINLSSSGDIFGFESDGIDGYNHNTITPAGSNPDTTGYGGPDAYFANITGSAANEPETGTVFFANGGILPQSTDYFSLESVVSFNAPPTTAPLPEPATLTILGVGMLAAGAARRLRRQG